MEKIKNVKDFKEFLKNNDINLWERAIDLDKLPKDDPWITDDKWDEYYKDMGNKNEKV